LQSGKAVRAVSESSEAIIARQRAFILRHTRLQRPPHVPELRLRLADDIVALWHQTEEEQGIQDAPPPFWAFAWLGGQAIARYLLDHPKDVVGKRVVDFATGSGLCAIAAMQAGAAHVLATDIDPFCAMAVTMNAWANGMRVAFTGHDLLDADPPETDIILAGDICYEAPLATRALSWLKMAHTRGTRVLIGDPGRAYFPREGLIQLADYQVPTTREMEGVAVKRTGVFTFPS
jgi:predicted nicotinamide N-methyase